MELASESASRTALSFLRVKDAVFNPRSYNLLFCVVGLMVSFLLYGILQERIMTYPYGEDKEMFGNSTYLVLNNRIVASLVALLMALKNKEEIKSVAPLKNYFLISFSNIAATSCQYESLKYISFPTQTLGKCGKTIPVLIIGPLIGSKKYSVQDYVTGGLITLGVSIFMLTGDISVRHKEQQDSLFGLLLMAGYLSCDGFTSTFQEKLFHGYKMSTYNQMLYINLCSGLMSMFGLLYLGQLWESIQFSLTHFDFMAHSFLLSLCSTCGQVVLFYTIKEFGALVFSTIMTTRQFVSIILSCLIYLNPLTFGQWIGSVVVTMTLYYQAVNSPKKHRPEPKEEIHLQVELDAKHEESPVEEFLIEQREEKSHSKF